MLDLGGSEPLDTGPDGRSHHRQAVYIPAATPRALAVAEPPAQSGPPGTVLGTQEISYTFFLKKLL